MKAMIALIDVPPESVILETQFLELTESGSKALGIDFTNASGQIGMMTFGSDGFVMSHVFCVVSGYSQGYPNISQREAETSATVKDGESFVIGGLTQEDVINSRSKVPLLGDIPLIGQAFRTDRTTRAKTELYIVVTPHVVRRGSAVGVPATVQIPASAMQ